MTTTLAMAWHSALLRGVSQSKPRSSSAYMLAQLKAFKDEHFIPQHYASIDDFARVHKLTLGKRGTQAWRLCERALGSIHGLPTSVGILTATDGIMCYIERLDGTLFCGHLASFEAEEKFSMGERKRTAKPKVVLSDDYY